MAASNPTTVVDFDFLPASYHEAGIQRKNITLRLVVVVGFAAFLGFGAVYQQHLRIVADQQLSDVLVDYERAQAQMQRLSQVSERLLMAEKRADLYAYLQHPWPRSQLLAALVEPLPDELEFTELCILREQVTGAEPENVRAPDKTADANQPKPIAEQVDLTAFRQRCDKSRIVVKIGGTAEDPVALHRYFEDVSRSFFVAKVDVGTIERIAGDSSGKLHFTARVCVRPCYGQPNGPTVKSGAPLTKSDRGRLTTAD
jgi:hypothetical protein